MTSMCSESRCFLVQIPVVTPYPIGSIPIYHQPTVPPVPHDQLLFPSIPPYFPHKKVLPSILPRLLGSLPYLHPGDEDIAAILSNPLLDTVLPLSAEAPTPGLKTLYQCHSCTNQPFTSQQASHVFETRRNHLLVVVAFCFVPPGTELCQLTSKKCLYKAFSALQGPLRHWPLSLRLLWLHPAASP